MNSVAHTVLEFALKNMDTANSHIFAVEREFPEGSEERNLLFLTRVDLDRARSRLHDQGNRIADAWQMQQLKESK